MKGLSDHQSPRLAAGMSFCEGTGARNRCGGGALITGSERVQSDLELG